MAELQEAHNEIHALRNNRDVHGARADEAARKVETARRAFDAAQAAAPVEVERDIDAEIAELRGQLDADTLAQFEEQRTENGIGVEEFKANKTCGGCSMVLPPAERAAILNAPANQLPQCSDCGSYLVRPSKARLESGFKHRGLSFVKVIIYADGGSRGNPGIAGSGTVIYAADGTTILDEIVYVVGKKSTNNVAEYYGLLRGVERAAELGATDVEFYMDSKLVVEQINGRWKIKHPDMQKLAVEAKKTINTFESFSLAWVARARNSVADKLSMTPWMPAPPGIPWVLFAMTMSKLLLRLLKLMIRRCSPMTGWAIVGMSPVLFSCATARPR